MGGYMKAVRNASRTTRPVGDALLQAFLAKFVEHSAELICKWPAKAQRPFAPPAAQLRIGKRDGDTHSC